MATKRIRDEMGGANDDDDEEEDMEPPLKKIHSVDVEKMDPCVKSWVQSDVRFTITDTGDNAVFGVFAEKKTLMRSSEVFRDIFKNSACKIDEDTGCALIDIKYDQDVSLDSWELFLIMLHHHAMPKKREPRVQYRIAQETEVLMGVIILCARYMVWSMYGLLRTRIEQVGHDWRKYQIKDRVSHPPKKSVKIDRKLESDIIGNLCMMMKLMSKWENFLIMGEQPGLWASPTAMKMLTFVCHALNRRQKFQSKWDDSKNFGNFLSMMTFAHQTTCGLLTRLNLSAENTYI